MKICIPIEVKPLGGVYTFLDGFVRYLEENGIAITGRPSGCDALFVNSWLVPARWVWWAKLTNPKLKVVQRIDGSARDYGREGPWDKMQGKVNLLCDLTIFQSQYSRHATREKYPVIGQDGPVIYNPVDLERFSPEGEALERGPGLNLAFVSFSPNPMKGAPEMLAMAGQNPDITFQCAGPMRADQDLPNLRALGVLPRAELPRLLRACDALLFLSRNEACPNVVLEAMACGLPVFYHDSGGTPELVGDCGATVEASSFRAVLAEARGRLPELGRAARQRVMEHNAPDVIFAQYLDAIRGAMRGKLPAPWKVLP